MEVKEWSFIFLFLLMIGTHCCSSLIAKEEHDSQWEDNQLVFQALRNRFGTTKCYINKQPTNVGLGLQQKENIG